MNVAGRSETGEYPMSITGRKQDGGRPTAGPCPECGALVGVRATYCGWCYTWRPHRPRRHRAAPTAHERTPRERRMRLRLALAAIIVGAASAASHDARAVRVNGSVGTFAHAAATGSARPGTRTTLARGTEAPSTGSRTGATAPPTPGPDLGRDSATAATGARADSARPIASASRAR